MKHRLLCIAALAAMVLPQLAAQQPLRIFIRSGQKTHAPGQHDYPAFLNDWKKLLSERGAVVDGAQRFPTAEELAKTDVMIIYSHETGPTPPEDRAILDSYLKRGGGIVVLHDGMCSFDPQWFSEIAGGAKKHGERNWNAGILKIKIEDRAHPIMAGAHDFELNDEMFFKLTVAPEMHVLATTPDPQGIATPQMWTMEKTAPGGQPFRSFVSMQGHLYASLNSAEFQPFLLRGIAWAGKRPVGTLLAKK